MRMPEISLSLQYFCARVIYKLLKVVYEEMRPGKLGQCLCRLVTCTAWVRSGVHIPGDRLSRKETWS